MHSIRHLSSCIPAFASPGFLSSQRLLQCPGCGDRHLTCYWQVFGFHIRSHHEKHPKIIKDRSDNGLCLNHLGPTPMKLSEHVLFGHNCTPTYPVFLLRNYEMHSHCELTTKVSPQPSFWDSSWVGLTLGAKGCVASRVAIDADGKVLPCQRWTHSSFGIHSLLLTPTSVILPSCEPQVRFGMQQLASCWVVLSSTFWPVISLLVVSQ